MWLNVITLSTIGWITGISATTALVLSCVVGIFLIYKSKKSNVKLLFYMGLLGILGGFWQLYTTLDFFLVLFTGKNISTEVIYTFTLAWIWPFIGGFFASLILFELLIQKFKWYLSILYLILTIVAFMFMIIDTSNNIYGILPDQPGKDLNEGYIVFGSPVFLISTIFLMTNIFLGGIGLYYKSIKSEGIIKKKFRYLSIYYIISSFFIMMGAAFEPLIPSGSIAIIHRLGMIGNYWFAYVALREESIEPKKKPPKKEITVEQSLFRISKRPDNITEEEVMIFKEKKICLVCKGIVSGINYICTNCGAYYCINCSQALSNLENQCWFCDTPIDESKPSKSFKEEEISVEEMEKKIGNNKPKRSEN